MRSKIVNRQSLNDLCFKLGLNELLPKPPKGQTHHRMVYGNMLEAFIGALFLDKGYEATRRFILHRLLGLHVSLKELEENESNYKSRLMEFSQKHKLPTVNFAVLKERNNNGQREFTVAARLGNREFGQGADSKKKYAEQKAAETALTALEEWDLEKLKNELGVRSKKKKPGKIKRQESRKAAEQQADKQETPQQNEAQNTPSTPAPGEAGSSIAVFTLPPLAAQPSKAKQEEETSLAPEKPAEPATRKRKQFKRPNKLNGHAAAQPHATNGLTRANGQQTDKQEAEAQETPTEEAPTSFKNQHQEASVAQDPELVALYDLEAQAHYPAAQVEESQTSVLQTQPYQSLPAHYIEYTWTTHSTAQKS